MQQQFSDGQQQYIDALKISDQDHQAIVNELDRGAAAPGRELRRSKRIPFKAVTGLILQVTHPGGTTVRFLVKPRNISSTGLSVMHGGFIHPGTKCSVPLKDLKGKATKVDGKVVSCRLIRGRIHELGVKFDKEIAVQQYVLDADASTGEQHGLESAPISLPSLQGRVIVADEWQDDRQLLVYDLHKLGLDAMEADGGADVLRRLQQSKYDVVLTGEWLGDMTAPDLAGAAKQIGSRTPLLGVYSAVSEDARLKAASAGIATIVQKPYKLERLAQVLMQHLRMAGADAEPAASGADLSEKWVEVGMRPMILAFLQGLDIRLGDLDAQMKEWAQGSAAQNPAQTCQRLKGAAASYGFPTISAAAEELANLLAAQAPLDAVKSSMDELATLAASALSAAEREVDRT